MAKFTINFIQRESRVRDYEVVEADEYVDHPPFVDFLLQEHAQLPSVIVARYRAEDIRRVLRDK